MLASIRRFAGTWPAKVFFVLLIASFGLWGVADVVRNLVGGADPTAVANVGRQRIDPAELQQEARRLLTQVQARVRASGGPVTVPTPEEKHAVAAQALERLVAQAALTGEADRLRVSVPDDALRQEVYGMRVFQGPDGQFSRALFRSALGANETRYFAMMRTDLAQRQLVEAVRAGGFAPDRVARLAYAYEGETRVADLVTLPFAGAAAPPAPTDEQIERQYDDTAAEYRAPEYRRVKVVILSPESVAKDIEISDADAHAFFDSHAAEFTRPDTRSVQVVVAPSEAAGKALATAWITGADWDAVQAQATAAGASAVELDDTTKAAFPAPDLAAAVFAAAPEAVTGPQPSEGGWAVFRVTKAAAAGSQPFEAVAAGIKARMALDQAADEVDARANKVRDALAGGAPLDELTGLGLTAVTGTLDAAGNTPDGAPAPIPGDPALLQAIVARAFTAGTADQPSLEDGPGHSFFALAVEAITPAEQLPLDRVRDRVRDDWLLGARRHAQDLVATRLMAAVEDGTSLKDAAAAADVPVTRSAPVGRTRQTAVPEQLVGPLFATAIGHATMVETPTGFIVAVPAAVSRPDPAADPAALDRLRRSRAAKNSDDLELVFAAALRERDHVTINRPMFDSIAQ